MGRHKIDIDWNLVEKRMEAGCTAGEIAACLRVSPDTFSDRFKDKYGVYFSDKSREFYSMGDANIRSVQYAKAMNGNIQMLFFLGKERLGQGKEEVMQSPFEESIALKHENMILRAELAEIKGKNEL
jgi:hypothetical protein